MDLNDTGIAYSTDPAALAHYTGDESSSFHGRANAVFLPRDLGEVCALVRRAAEQRAPLTVSGAGTSITGSRVPSDGVVLSTERLRRWPEVLGAGIAERADLTGWERLAGADYAVALSPGGDTAAVPAGVRLSELDRLLGGRGLLYPPDPTEMTAMIGGTIATNASGSRSYRYGATREWIEALLVVTAAGEPVWVCRGEHVAAEGELVLPSGFPATSVTIPDAITLPKTKHAAGFHLEPRVDLVDLLVGSEGTLGVVVAAIVRLARRPESTLQLAAFFPSASAAFAATDAARADSDVLAIEYFDGRSLAFMRSVYPQTPDAEACVMFESTFLPRARHNPYPDDGWFDRWSAILNDAGASTEWAATGEELRGMRAFRHALPEAINRWVGARVGKLGTDMAVPAERFSEMHAHYLRAQDSGIHSALFGHLGQYHLHLNFLPEDRDELVRALGVYRGLAKAAVGMGGTVSAEHGVGKKTLADETGVPRPYLYYQYGGHGVRAMQAVKSALDPEWMFNPGTMVPRR